MAVQYFASGKFGKIIAGQATYAKASLDSTESLVLPVMVQSDDAQTFTNWSISSVIETYDRSNTLARTKQIGIGMSSSTITISGFINPYQSMGYFLGQLVRIQVVWLNSEVSNTPYTIDLYCTITKIDKSGSVDGAFQTTIEGQINYSFDQNDSNFVILKSATNPSDRGWIPRTPDLTQKLWSV